MGLSERSRKKHLDAAAKLTPPGTAVRAYAVGNVSPRFSTSAAVAIGVFVAVFVVGLAFGVIFYPGALLLLYLNHSIRPPRGLAVSDSALFVMHRSFLNSRPSKLLASVPFFVLSGAQSAGSKVRLQVDQETVVLRKSEYDRLVSATVTMP